jgi:hypothetical protein
VLAAGVVAVVGVDDADDDTLSGVVDAVTMARSGVAVTAASGVGVDASEPKNPPPEVGIENEVLVAAADIAAPQSGLLILPDDPKIPDAVLLLDTCALSESTAPPRAIVEVVVGAPKPKIGLAGDDVCEISIFDPKAVVPNEVVVVVAAGVEVVAVAFKPKIGWAGGVLVIVAFVFAMVVALVVRVAAVTVVPAPVTTFCFSVGTSMDGDGCGWFLLGDEGNGTTRCRGAFSHLFRRLLNQAKDSLVGDAKVGEEGDDDSAAGEVEVLLELVAMVVLVVAANRNKKGRNYMLMPNTIDSALGRQRESVVT